MYRSIPIALLLIMTVSVVVPAQQPPRKTVWAGVYTAAQAERGQAAFETHCINCHQGDIADDDSAARFRDRNFMERWRESDLESFYTFIKVTMPRRRPGSLPENVYVDIVANFLHANRFPTGSQELTFAALKGIQIEGKDGPKPLGGGALVQIVGCLAKDEKNAWMITQATEPARTARAMGSTASEMDNAMVKPLGNQIYRLQSVDYLGEDFMIESHLGHKVQTKGLLIRQPDRDRIDITSMEVLGESCGVLGRE
ncbi:MAG: cytochrome c [Acidobacteria bacterium]|nr:cytochrome c [Acidobacteriota bacterium]